MSHPTAKWTVQQFAAALLWKACRLLVHDHSDIFAPAVHREKIMPAQRTD